MTMTMDGAMALTAEGDVSYQDSGPEMSMRMNMPHPSRRGQEAAPQDDGPMVP